MKYINPKYASVSTTAIATTTISTAATTTITMGSNDEMNQIATVDAPLSIDVDVSAEDTDESLDSSNTSESSPVDKSSCITTTTTTTTTSTTIAKNVLEKKERMIIEAWGTRWCPKEWPREWFQNIDSSESVII